MAPPGTHTNPHTPRVRNGEPQPAPVGTPEPASSRRDLTSWWRQFSKRPAKKDDDKGTTCPSHGSGLHTGQLLRVTRLNPKHAPANSQFVAITDCTHAEPALPGIFGVPLIQSIPYANVAISLFNEHGESYIYGYVPIVVAKCGVFLKEKATDVEGIFRLAGSEKRIKELRTAFDTPPRYGKGLDWSGYTVHDAANILRRYFNNLPEPIIPLQHYDPFRDPLKGHQAEAVGPSEGQQPSVGGFDPDAAVRTYQHEIKALPSLNRQLLLYILDLLAVFAAKADVNKMTTSNLAAIFQPGLLSHPQHDMSPVDYRLSQDVLIFLIDNQDHFLIGMEGTAVDEGTVKHIESGPSTPQARTPTTPRNSSGIGRSASTTSSAGAESLRQYGGVRRNVSTSSKRSRRSGAVPSPITPAFVTPTTSGVHRSNTLPSKRSPALGSPRFPAAKQAGPEETKSPLSSPMPADIPESSQMPEPEQPSHITEAPRQRPQSLVPTIPATRPVDPELAQPQRALTMPPNKIEMPSPYQPYRPPETAAQPTEPLQHRPAVTPATHNMPGGFPLPSPGIIPPSQPTTPNVPMQTTAQNLLPPRSTTPGTRTPQRSPLHSPHHTPTRERSEFMEAPVDSGPAVELTPAVRTFTQILAKVAASPPNESKESKDGRKPNKLQKKRMPNSVSMSAHSSTHSLGGSDSGFGGQFSQGPPSPLQPPSLPFAHGQSQASSSRDNLPDSSRASGNTLKPSMSPSASFRSHSTATEYSETEQLDDQPAKEEKRSFWKGHRRGESKATPTTSTTDLHGSVPGADKSMSSFASSSGWTTAGGGGGGGRRSMQYDTNQSSDSILFGSSPPDSERSDKKGAFDWFHKRRQDHKERVDRRERAKSPPGSSSHLPMPRDMVMQSPESVVAARGRAVEMPSQNIMQSPESLAARGRGTADVVRETGGETPSKTDRDKSSDVTPTGTSPTPPQPPNPASSASPKSTRMSPAMALRTDLPAALTEPRSVARSPDRNPRSPVTTMAPAQSFPTPPPATQIQNLESSQLTEQQVEAGAPTQHQPQPGTEKAEEGGAGQVQMQTETVSTPSGPMHSSSGSTATVTPQMMEGRGEGGGGEDAHAPASPTADDQSAPSPTAFIPQGHPAP
ncbi:hypothetical protein G6011_09499 [Alternaria panax]|uniref:Rho-GAP domain-containing protein n=1 Tax=Alternaria panax TaxID=48097 RepID=A0AAD4IB26_9PLEO|nr:hypothetical protein G6011_09499 [Alternaria panax]